MPFDLGARFVLRLIIPSIILAIAFYPLTVWLRALIYPELSVEIAFIGTGLVAGFGLLLLDMPIYMLLEGRRYWPASIRRWSLAREERRLTRLVIASNNEVDPAVAVEFDLRAARFPIDRSTGEPKAVYPTQLGNLLASFETYPTVKYGIDGVFFWSRLWVSIDKDLRDELDSAQAVVDGAIYACAAFGLSAILAFAYFIIALPSITTLCLVGFAFSILASLICYRGALPRYAQYGELFAAVFDQYRSKLELATLVADLDRHSDPATLRTRSEREVSLAAWRFLRWHRYRKVGSSASEIVKGF